MHTSNAGQDSADEAIPAQYYWAWLGKARAKLIAVLVATACTFGTVQAASQLNEIVNGLPSCLASLHSGQLPGVYDSQPFQDEDMLDAGLHRNFDRRWMLAGGSLQCESPVGAKNFEISANHEAIVRASASAQSPRDTADVLSAGLTSTPSDPAPIPLVLLSLGFAAITYSRVPHHSPQSPTPFSR